MKIVKFALAATLINTGVYAEDITSQVGLNANILVANNCVWRGMTQTSDKANVQGALTVDYSGFYIGSAASNIEIQGLDAWTEVDFYGGYASSFYGLDYDLGAISYTYPQSPTEANFSELYFALSKNFEIVTLGAKFYKGVKTNDAEVSDAAEATVSIPLPMEFSFDALYGDYYNVGDYFSLGFSKQFNETFKATIFYTGIKSDTGEADEYNLIIAPSAAF
jgi:uncharacterized protein (TIGR02001 family)